MVCSTDSKPQTERNSPPGVAVRYCMVRQGTGSDDWRDRASRRQSLSDCPVGARGVGFSWLLALALVLYTARAEEVSAVQQSSFTAAGCSAEPVGCRCRQPVGFRVYRGVRSFGRLFQ